MFEKKAFAVLKQKCIANIGIPICDKKNVDWLWAQEMVRIFYSPILFAICTSTVSKLHERLMLWHVEKCSVVLLCN
jgi:hypothetical protein